MVAGIANDRRADLRRGVRAGVGRAVELHIDIHAKATGGRGQDRQRHRRAVEDAYDIRRKQRITPGIARLDVGQGQTRVGGTGGDIHEAATLVHLPLECRGRVSAETSRQCDVASGIIGGGRIGSRVRGQNQRGSRDRAIHLNPIPKALTVIRGAIRADVEHAVGCDRGNQMHVIRPGNQRIVAAVRSANGRLAIGGEHRDAPLPVGASVGKEVKIIRTRYQIVQGDRVGVGAGSLTHGTHVTGHQRRHRGTGVPERIAVAKGCAVENVVADVIHRHRRSDTDDVHETEVRSVRQASGRGAAGRVADRIPRVAISADDSGAGLRCRIAAAQPATRELDVDEIVCRRGEEHEVR